jgi:glucosamine--fructose-6-phosphate aminotransferase (isomerizing)
VIAFESELLSQGAALRTALDRYGDGDGVPMRTVRAAAAAAPEVVLAAMGSSLSAAIPAAQRLAFSKPTAVWEAGELLHYGTDAVRAGALVVLVSQSGRSAETLALGERLRAAGATRIVAVTNDEASPLGALAEVSLPILAGDETTVATKTFMTTFVVLQAVVDAIVGQPRGVVDEALEHDLPGIVDGLSADPAAAMRAAELFVGCCSLILVARGPALAAADYGALIVKETAALPAEAMAGGSFRHGPIEIAGPRVGLVVLAPAGRTRDLCIRLAVETSELGSPTWLIADDGPDLPPATDRRLITKVPGVPEQLAPLTLTVPIQRLAAALASGAGREPGTFLRSSKVTDIE